MLQKFILGVGFALGLGFHGGYSTFINSFDKINFCFNLPATQHHSFFRN